MRTVSGHVVRDNPAPRLLLDATASAHGLSDSEVIVYAAIFDAAECGEVCPDHEELMELLDFSSTSGTPDVVERLEVKGLLLVKRVQKYRQVRINATGKWTARDPRQHSDAGHVPKGTHDPKPLKRALLDLAPAELKSRSALLAIIEAMADELIGDPVLARRFEQKIDRAKELIQRRRWPVAVPTERKLYRKGRL